MSNLGSKSSSESFAQFIGPDPSGLRHITSQNGIHLPRRIGQALFDAWEGDFDFRYDEEGYFIRVSWSRDY
jgi:hypothetical protein